MNVVRITGDAPAVSFGELSELDKECIGAEGWSAESFRSEAAKKNGIVLACVTESGGLAGLLTGYTAAGEADITSVAVQPEMRRQGIGRMLMESFFGLLPEDTEAVFLEVRRSNVPAQRLYESFGFESIAVRKNFYSDPVEDALVMLYSIRNSE